MMHFLPEAHYPRTKDNGLKSGKTYRAVATKVGASLSSVVRWHQVYRKHGNHGLKPKPVPGRPARMTTREKQRLVQLLVAGPLKAGYSTDVWTLPWIAQMIRKHWGIRYCLSNVWKLMAALGWSCQKPERRALQRDEKAIAHWKRPTWPHIKNADRVGAHLVFVDESGFLLIPNLTRTWAPKGRTPVHGHDVSIE